jgi:hypothetical protein
MPAPETIRIQILDLVKEYHTAKIAPKVFDPDKDLVHYAGINKSFFIGFYPGIDDKRLNHIKAVFDRFMTGERVS